MRHLQKEERLQIQTLLEMGHGVDSISKYLCRHRSTIYREMNRGGVDVVQYSAEVYHDQARKNMGRSIERSPTPETIQMIEAKILNEQWSPEQISNWLKLHHEETVSHTWIYRYIQQDKSEGGELFNHLRRGSYSKGHKEYRGHIPNRISIEERPDTVNDRKRLGDYEIDLIVGPKNKGAILTMIDRVSRHCILEKLHSKKSSEVSDKVIELMNAYQEHIFTITSDNGTEFTEHTKISNNLKLDYYFAHPYASYERGSIENLNGLVRQYLPKGTELVDMENDEIKNIQNKLNRRPRKVLGFLSPIEYNLKYSMLQLDV